MFFLHGPTGTGKTYVYNTLCYALRGHADGPGKIVLCVASSEIAALLLMGGRTSHTTFKIPINITEQSFCGIKKGSIHAELLRILDLIIWDEVPMQHRHCQEAVDRTLRDIHNDDRPFGGVTVVFGGDFQQILPVIPKGSREQIVSACMQRSRLWQDVHVMHLTKNMRLDRGVEEVEFAKWILDIGHGQNSTPKGQVKLSDHMKCGKTEDTLVDALYPGITTLAANQNHDAYFLERTILSARNDDVDKLNLNVLKQFSGESQTFHSADSVVYEEGVDDEDMQYPLEYLNSINASGLPLAKLELKVGCPVMILRNLDPSKGLCNGSRGILTHISTRVLEIRLLGGEHEGNIFHSTHNLDSQ